VRRCPNCPCPNCPARWRRPRRRGHRSLGEPPRAPGWHRLREGSEGWRRRPALGVRRRSPSRARRKVKFTGLAQNVGQRRPPMGIPSQTSGPAREVWAIARNPANCRFVVRPAGRPPGRGLGPRPAAVSARGAATPLRYCRRQVCRSTRRSSCSEHPQHVLPCDTKT
jgi:hypothetical protein